MACQFKYNIRRVILTHSPYIYMACQFKYNIRRVILTLSLYIYMACQFKYNIRRVILTLSLYIYMACQFKCNKRKNVSTYWVQVYEPGPWLVGVLSKKIKKLGNENRKIWEKLSLMMYEVKRLLFKAVKNY